MTTFSFSPTWHSRRQYEIFHCGARFVILPGGRRSGKTTGAMNYIAEQGLTRPNIKILWVDTTQNNIAKYVSEILLPILPKGSFNWNQQLKVLKFTSGSVVHFGSAERPENLEGFGYQIVILNEAGIILKGASGEDLWNKTLRPMIMEEKDGKRCQVFFVGTPKGAGLFKSFAEKAESDDPDWRRFNLSTYDNPLLPRSEIDDLVAASPGKIAQQEVYGEFIDDDEGEAVIPTQLTNEALKRESVEDMHYHVIWGVDVARGGNDRSVLVKRRWNTILKPVVVWKGLDTVQLADELKKLYLLTEPKIDRPREILVDESGLGSGVVDYGRRVLGLPIRGVNVSRKPQDERKYTQLRDELWWKCRAWMETGSLDEEIELARELSRPVIDMKVLNEKGLMKVESKLKMESRLGSIEGKSPDIADAFVFTFACGIERKADRREGRDYGRNDNYDDNYSFMGA